jgi:diaminohydroxyphosphoribosylaminopyrimidine deaminase / 5-amino-6-(5-phosphoribosylamino)uracil reductase
MYNETDIAWMTYAITLAKKGMYTTRENPRVGCVLVKNGEKIGEGWHEFPGGPHAEVNALKQAGMAAKDATCYVTLAPCTHYGKTPPCFDALKKAGIGRIIAATRDPNPLVDHTDIESGLCSDEARALNPGFFMRMQSGRPFVRLKTGMSLDGRTAMQNGQSQWITGPDARSLVQKIRAQSDVILTGINTVLMDDPSLTVRDDEILAQAHFKQPIRVILDRQLRIPLHAKLLQLPGPVWIYTEVNHQEKIQQLSAMGATVHIMPTLEIDAVLKDLAKAKINEVLVEAGSILNGAFLQANLVDEWHLFVAPKILGDAAHGLCTLPQVTQLSQAIALNMKQCCRVGEDYYYIASIRQ